MELTRKKNITGMVAAFTGNIIFGFTFVFTKQILNAGMSPYVLLSWRLIIATVALAALAACGVFKMNFTGKKWLRMAPVGMAEPCLYFVCESYGIANTTASESGTIIALIPIAVLILSRLIFKERHTRGQLIGVMLSVVGIICVVLAGGFSASFSLSGYLLLFGAVVIAGFYNIGVRWLRDEFNSAEITFGTNVLGLVFFTLLACTEGLIKGNMATIWLLPLENTQVLVNIILLALGASIGAFMLVTYAIGTIGPTRSSSFAGITTITSILFGLMLLGERMLPWQLIGAALIIVGVWSANYFVSSRGKAGKVTKKG
ncbi:MAG: DMT family transporter [Clostridiales bacterium]|nr:DMT family transporter [Clostridiales bacterium]